LGHGNALIFQRNFFLPMVKARSAIRQNSSLLISKGNLRDPDFAWFQPLSISIGRFLRPAVARRAGEFMNAELRRHRPRREQMV
jgi:hypothetical protein